MTTTQEDTYAPVKVHVASVAAGVELGAGMAPRKGYRGQYQTFVLTSNDPVQCILPEDPARAEAYILPLNNDVVIGPKGVVQASGMAPATELTPSNPAAGSGYTYTNEGTVPMVVTSVHAHFVADATVANRFVEIKILDTSSNIVALIPASGAVAANATIDTTLAAGVTTVPSGTSGAIAGGLPKIILQPGWSFEIIVVNMDANDQLSGIVIVFAAALPAQPQGTYVPSVIAGNVPLPVRDCNAVFAAATSTTTSSLVSVAAYYKE